MTRRRGQKYLSIDVYLSNIAMVTYIHTFAQLLANEDISSSILLQLTHADMLRLSQICKAAQAATVGGRSER